MRDFLNTLSGKVIAILTIIALVFGVVAEGVSIYRNGEEAKTATETANNAAKLKLAEAEERAQLAKKAASDAETARAAADNAAKLKLAEAQKVAADAETAKELAKKAAADAETARAIADNAGKLKLAEAEEKAQLAKKAAADAETAKAAAAVSQEMQEATLAAKRAEARKLDGEATISQVKACAADDSKCTPEQRCILEGRSNVGDRYSELSTAIVAKLAPDSPLSIVGNYNQKCAHLRNEVEAQPTSAEIPPKCRQPFADWQGYTSHAAFAVYGGSECVWSPRNNSYGSTAQAVAALKNYCIRNRLAGNIIATK